MSARLTAVRFDRACGMQVLQNLADGHPHARTVFIVACLVSLRVRSLPQILILGCIVANASDERCRWLQNLRSDKWRTR
ncbi:hypothetical protein QT970_19360 [Microcoleus sp. herbarium8]|uniref:hypothetical protein n=1 Tax=Microcoleus sp. herbarium8 TaxID=3055436 RepID=UPI002FD57BDD